MSKSRKLLVDLGIAFLASAFTAALCYPISFAIGYQTVGLIFLIVIAGLSLFLGRSALIFAAILSFAVWNFLFITPLYTFRVHHLHDLIALVANLSVAIVGSTLISRIRKSQLSLRKSQEQLSLLYGFLESLNNAVSIKDVVRRAGEFMKRQFDAEIVIYLKEKEGEALSPIPFGNGTLHSDQAFTDACTGFAKDHQEPTRSLIPSASGLTYFSLKEPRKKFGILGAIVPEDVRKDAERSVLLHSCIRQIAASLEREISIDQAKEKEILVESEKLFRTILNSVSHEIKTPIAIISAAVSSLADERTSANQDLRNQIIRELELASERLNHLVENILEMSRIESGVLRMNFHYCDIADVIGTLVNSLKQEWREHQVKLDIREDLPLIRADIGLLTQALTNVVRNAIAYTPPGSEIRIDALQGPQGGVEIRVLDLGQGIPDYAIPRVFEKFYRVPGTKPGGTGLGLTIVKAIIDAHRGSLSLRNQPGAGLLVQIFLSKNPEDPHGTESL
ncbi:MAG: DUF4118 domain-containing protein [Bacteroidetes bacterium]|nr:MAG: DUF4118 domain-containing protein [Bacteroidota bacterium]